MSLPKRYGHKATAIGSVIRQRDDGEFVLYSDYAALAAENEVLRNKVEWMRQAEHLVIWDGERWKVRQEILPK